MSSSLYRRARQILGVDVFGVLVLGREAHRRGAASSSINTVYCILRLVRNVGVRFSIQYLTRGTILYTWVTTNCC